MHHDGSIVSIGPREKPETVVFYNKTKMINASVIHQHNTGESGKRKNFIKKYSIRAAPTLSAKPPGVQKFDKKTAAAD
ncbi:hypothetical protein T05_2509 [Trichinella murrelli]|uniref:60S ribosomal protein L28 n=1 Tax=Trichinella murrelli TaxID=144512 RepID=A0A0V0TT67_9BILA|nr:hypothetical protein T05_2509 [Trichinella murrelli]